MIPLDDWMILELWEPQVAQIEAALVLPDSVDKERDDAAVFRVLATGPDVKKVKTGDVIALGGTMAIAKMKKPNGEYALVGRDSDSCFIMEESDLIKKGEGDEGPRIQTR